MDKYVRLYIDLWAMGWTIAWINALGVYSRASRMGR